MVLGSENWLESTSCGIESSGSQRLGSGVRILGTPAFQHLQLRYLGDFRMKLMAY